MSPFKILHGYNPPQLTFELASQSKVVAVDQWLQERQVMAKVLKSNLEKVQQRMKFYVDGKRTEREPEVGDCVYIKLQPYGQTSIALRSNLKLTSKYYGPYSVIKKISHCCL